MLETLTQGFRSARMKLQGKTQLSEENIKEAVRDIRRSLLEGDVAYDVVQDFVADVTEKAMGEVVQTRFKSQGQGTMKASPADHFVSICHDKLVSLMGPVDTSLVEAEKGPTGIMMVGLQGAGKTTTTGKLARMLRDQGRKPMLVAADCYRPAAVDQLMVLGRRLQIPVFHLQGMKPPQLCKLALQQAKSVGRDVIIYDTAGRLAIDDGLMRELEEIKAVTRPENVLFVCDAMIGQDAVQTAAEFNRRLAFNGFILTKLDGDARGGAALSIKQVTGVPIKYLGMGEALDKLEEFRPEGLASRILGMGDIVGLMQDFQAVVDEETAEKSAEKILEGRFNYDDFLDQLRMVKKMGSLKDLFEKIPMFGDFLPEGANIDDRELLRVEAVIQSMTNQERNEPQLILNSRSRRERVARGSGTPTEEVDGLVDRFEMARKMMKTIGGEGGMLGQLRGGAPGGGKLTRKQRRRMQSMGIDPEQAMGGGGPKPLSATDRRALRNKRKKARKARQRGRK